MNIRQRISKTISYLIPQKEHDSAQNITSVNWLGHKRTFDFDGHIVSDQFIERGRRITRTYYPGTRLLQRKKKVLQEQINSENLDHEVWYDMNGNMRLYFSPNTPDVGLLLLNRGFQTKPIKREVLQQTIYPVLEQLKSRTEIVDYDLNDISQNLSHILSDQLPSIRIEVESAQDTSSNQNTPTLVKRNITPVLPIVQEAEATVTKVEIQAQEKTKNEVEAQQPATEEKPKQKRVVLPPNLLRQQLEEKWFARQQKLDLLLMKKAKIEQSKRMTPEHKMQRLASIEKQLAQNEKAQILLNKRLQVLDKKQTKQKCQELKQQQRADYQKLLQQLKEKRDFYKTFQGPLTKEQQQTQRLEMRQLRELKTMAYNDYKAANELLKETQQQLRILQPRKTKTAVQQATEQSKIQKLKIKRMSHRKRRQLARQNASLKNVHRKSRTTIAREWLNQQQNNQI